MQDWTQYNGGNITNLTSIASPYQEPTSGDISFEYGGINGTKIDSINAAQITTGVLTAVTTIGGGSGTSYVQIDGTKQRIIVNDGTDDRILIGYLAGAF